MFCSMFKIPNLADVIKIFADGDNEHPSLELTNFYRHTIDLIQSFLIKHNGLSETRSNYFQSIFARMKILYVDRIRFSYSYNNNIKRTSTSLKTHSTYIDESIAKFFILKTIEKPEKHINTMVNYLIENESMRHKLGEFIKNLFKTYQQKGEEGLTSLRQTLPSQADTFKWIIPSIAKEPEPLLLEQEEEDDEQRISIHNSSVNISDEAIENMKKESDCFPLKLQPNKVDVEGPKPLVSFPAKLGILGLNLPLNTVSQERKSQPVNVTKEKIFTSSASENDQDEKKNKHVQQRLTINNDGQFEQKKKPDEQVVLHNNNINSNVNVQQRSTEGERSSHRTLTIRNISLTQAPSAIFEFICVSNIRDFNLSISNALPSAANPSLTSLEDDLKTGRCGEDLVFRYLQWKHPDKQIEWVNQHTESGLPFDIRLVHKTTNNETELIEVKTTRSCNQNTFQMSIGEIECLLANPKNYSIYRVYYTDDEKSSTITILSQLKVNLQNKNLVLSMTIMAKSNKK
ncbi:unnamed protein product [Rotaria sp. Silwood2]|nr:unnamed protein product [Rotaria sp. Silwood2]CAF3319470.1 unnamed protein product [Rotaria sp. Silwood2]CAF4607163.1 unnamed protein product [Rotaria sp. Silwood2]